MDKSIHKFVSSHCLYILILKFDAFVISGVSMAYGWFLIYHPQLLNYSEVYEIISLIFTSKILGGTFVGLGVINILSIVLNSRILKTISISLLFGLWVFFGAALFQSDATNTTYIHSFGWSLICLGVVLREMVE